MNLFIDQELQRKFDEQGYVVINFADSTTVARLQQIFTSIYPKTPEGFFSSSYDKDIVFKQNLSNQLRELLDPLVKKICHHFRPLGCSFLSKSPGISSFMPVHQDWTVVDESKFASVTIWMPLTDTDEKNGALKVLPGSHRFSDALRSPTIPGAFDYLKEDIYPLMNWVKLKAGQAIIFNHALLHASPPNLSDSDRIVVTYGLIPEEAELYFYNRISEHQVAKFRVPYDFFITYNNIGQPPESAELIETLEYAESPFTINLLNRKMYQYRKNKSSAMRPLFKKPEHQSFFEQNGYIVLPALQQHQIDALRAYYLSTGLKDEKGYGFHVGMDAEDKQLVKEMVDKIKEIALAQVQNYLTDIQLFTASFVVKEPNPMGVVPPHQDWTFVEDEESFCSVTCWI
ncbi:MAG: phytanoyl-CoA dioxygenase family protein, partial [Chitinophagales bacterium]|nr:phytanoyl-CoA dioxygenase family protein [Chitinophagales bacterium]MDW8274491.1 phytanoyl-CoA dioxygenase family protein [Chitinophagales bacterium]